MALAIEPQGTLPSSAAIAGAIDRPLNVLASPGMPPVAELTRLGVRRLSAGSAIAQGALTRARALAAAFLRDGQREAPSDGAITHRDMNALLAGR